MNRERRQTERLSSGGKATTPVQPTKAIPKYGNVGGGGNGKMGGPYTDQFGNGGARKNWSGQGGRKDWKTR